MSIQKQKLYNEIETLLEELTNQVVKNGGYKIWVINN